MSEFNQNEQQTITYHDQSALQKYMAKTFGVMTIGLALTAIIAYVSYQSLISGGIVYNLLLENPYIIFIVFIVELVIVGFLSFRINKMAPITALILFILYAVITGFTFSVLPMAYGVDNMFIAFGFAAVLFLSMSLIGYTTKIDLTKYSTIIYAGLFCLVIVSVVGFFINLEFMEMAICYIGIGIFLILTAVDIQKIKNFYFMYEEEPAMLSKSCVFGALQLYLDFVNIFLYILRLLGRGRRRN